MATLEHASRGDLQAIVDQFAAISWPAEQPEVSAIAERLGWTLDYESSRRLSYQTSLADRSFADLSVRDGHVSLATIDISSGIDRDDSTQQAELANAFEEICSDLKDTIGIPVNTTRGEFPRVTWDLPNRGRVAVQRLGEVIQFVVLQEEYADIERFEESRGIPLDRDPESDLT